MCLFSGLAGDYLRLYFPGQVEFRTILVGKHASQTTDFIPIDVHFGEDTVRTNNTPCPAAGHGFFSCSGIATYVFIALAQDGSVAISEFQLYNLVNIALNEQLQYLAYGNIQDYSYALGTIDTSTSSASMHNTYLAPGNTVGQTQTSLSV